MAMTRSQMRRQLYRGGGIASLPRQNYGLGSWVKERVRKIIPNELADIASKAAPFVAPFNPLAAGIMRGVGRFDKRGSISDALKQGLLTYGGGQLMRHAGGAGVQGLPEWMGGQGVGGTYGFSSPIGTDTGFRIGNWGKTQTVSEPVKSGIGEMDQASEFWGKQMIPSGATIPTTESDPFSLKGIMDKWNELGPAAQTAIVGVGSGALAGVAQWFENQIPQEPGESTEEYMARRKVAVGELMLQYMDNTRAYDAEWTSKTLEQKKAEVAKYNMNKGGRVGLYAGGNGKWGNGKWKPKPIDIDDPGHGEEPLIIPDDADISPSDDWEGKIEYRDRLQTNAQPITYSGDEGPKAPIRMATQAVPLKLQRIILQYWIQYGNGSPVDRFEDVPQEFKDNIIRLYGNRKHTAQGGRIGYRFGPGPVMEQAGLPEIPGIPRMAEDGLEYDMSEHGGFQPLGAQEGKDDVKANLAKNEFVFTADAVRGAGGGDIELGAQKMYDTMKKLEGRVT